MCVLCVWGGGRGGRGVGRQWHTIHKVMSEASLESRLSLSLSQAWVRGFEAMSEARRGSY